MKDTKQQFDRTRFEETERELCQGLTEIRREILNKEVLRNRIVEKYKIKNVTGYSDNAFVDFEHPMDIFAHLLIGAEDGAVLESGVSEENMLNTMNKFFKYNPKAPFDGDQVWASLRNNNPPEFQRSSGIFLFQE